VIQKQLRMLHIARKRFKNLIKPARPPFPGTATPAGYVLHKQKVREKRPENASQLERLRDWLLEILTQPLVGVLLVAWLVALVVVLCIFAVCFLDLPQWGYATLEDYGCDTETFDAFEPRFLCNATSGALSYSLDAYYEQRMAFALATLFTYATLIAAPWRISVLVQCFHGRRMRRKDGSGIYMVGVDFYGRKSDFNFFHIPWGQRLVIAIALNLGIVFQVANQVLHLLYNDVVSYAVLQPSALLLLITGPPPGVVFGGIAGSVQFFAESALHQKDPKRFPSSVLDTICPKSGQASDQKESSSLMGGSKSTPLASYGKV